MLKKDVHRDGKFTEREGILSSFPCKRRVKEPSLNIICFVFKNLGVMMLNIQCISEFKKEANSDGCRSEKYRYQGFEFYVILES